MPHLPPWTILWILKSSPSQLNLYGEQLDSIKQLVAVKVEVGQGGHQAPQLHVGCYKYNDNYISLT